MKTNYKEDRREKWPHQQWNWGQMGPDWRLRFGQRGWLRPMVLKALEEEPRNGIEIMDHMQQISQGWWRPSPGSVYPLLDTLVTEGLVKKRSDGRYELTDAYRREKGPISQAEQVLTSMEGEISYLQDLAQSNKKEFASHKQRIEGIVQKLSKLK